MTMSDRAIRSGRLLEPRAGTWGGSSADFKDVVRRLSARGSHTHRRRDHYRPRPWRWPGPTTEAVLANAFEVVPLGLMKQTSARRRTPITDDGVGGAGRPLTAGLSTLEA
jgi:hypothetical protein